MRVALINDIAYKYASGDPTAVGGSERYQWLLAKALAEHGWSPIIGVRFALAHGQRVRIAGVDFVSIGSGNLLAALLRFFVAERPDWCFWFGSTHLLGPAVVAGWLTGTRSLFAAQFDLDVRPSEALSERRNFWPLFALGLAGCRKIFLQHTGQYADLPRRWRHKAHVIPGVVAMPEASTPHADRERYVAWVGVLRQPKRPDLLIEIARRCPDINFVVCGGTSLHRSPPGYGERMVAELSQLPNVKYLGHVAPDRSIAVIAGAALLLSTSEAEGFPSVFVEAWAHGTPVVTMTIDPDQVIARHGLGAVASSVDAAARDVHRLVASSEAREDIACRTRAFVARTHSSVAVARVAQEAIHAKSAPVLLQDGQDGEPVKT